MSRRSSYDLPGMCCGTEAAVVVQRIGKVDGVREVRCDVLAKRVQVDHDLEDDAPIRRTLEGLAMGFVPAQECGVEGCTCGTAKAASRWDLAALVLAGALAAAAEGTAWAVGRDGHPAVVVLAVIAILLSGRRTALKGWSSLRTLTLNIGFLMSIAIVGAVALGSWPEAAMVCFLFELAERIEDHSTDRARNAIRGLMEIAPNSATIRGSDGAWITVAAGEVQVGQIGLVRPGELIPFDGQVTSGATSVNQASITGESMPIEKDVGDPVYAGTLNEQGAFEYRVSTDQGHTTIARIIHTVQEAQAQRAPTQRFVDNFARSYTPLVVAVAALVALGPPLIAGASWHVWVYRALVLLVISCPCALVISTPVTVVSGLAVAARQGILVKGGVHLEKGRKLRVVALDKTGTLTVGKPNVTDVAALDSMSREQILAVAAGLSAMSSHPISHAVAQAWSGPVPAVDDFAALAGRGVTGVVEGRRYHLGNHRLAEERGVCGDHVEDVLLPLEREGKTVVILSTDQRSVGVIAVSDTLREASVHAVAELHELGLMSAILSGDNEATARAVADKAGIDDVRAELLPGDKLAAVRELAKTHGPVGMVGDGINDAPALAAADIGISLGLAGTGVALETADVALMDDDLRKLPAFIRLSRRTAAILTQNIAIAIGLKAAFFALAIMGRATLWMAVFADMGASLIVVANGLRMLRPKR